MAEPQQKAESAAVEDILIMDGNATVLAGLERVLREAGLNVTATRDPERARDQLIHRFYAAVVVDLDTPQPMEGLQLLQFTRQHSPLTAVVMMTPRRTFEAVAAAFRGGAADVVPKTQDALPYLRECVLKAARNLRAGINRDLLLEEVAEMHEDFLKEMMDLSRHVTDLEDKILRGDSEGSTTSVPSTLDLLCVDDRELVPSRLNRELKPETGWRVRVVQTGGEALDAATQRAPHVLVVKDPLPDLPISMLVKSVKAVSADLVAIAFRPPGERAPGEISMVESSRVVVLVPVFSNLDQLIASLHEVREALRRKAQERRYLGMFRLQHADFLKRYQLIKNKLARK